MVSICRWSHTKLKSKTLAIFYFALAICAPKGKICQEEKQGAILFLALGTMNRRYAPGNNDAKNIIISIFYILMQPIGYSSGT